MAISHVCLGCGLDLARVRAAPDPHYGLPLVVCPRCGAACVRVHPSRIGWRGTRRVRRATAGLAAQSAIILASAAITTTAAIAMAVERFNPRAAVEEFIAVVQGEEDLMTTGALLVAGALLALGALVGLWLSATLRHMGAPRAILLWGAVVQAMVLATLIVQLATVRAGTHPSHPAEVATLELWPRVAAAAGLITLLTLTGAPLGIAARAGLDRRRSRWIAKTLRRRRLGRTRA